MAIETDDASAQAGDYASLLKQRRTLDSKLAELRAAAIEQFRQRIVAEAAELEIDPVALLSPPKRRRDMTSEPTEVRYRDPDNPDHVWSGRGRPPRWLQDRIDAGSDKDDFLSG